MKPEQALSFLRQKQEIGQRDNLDIRIVSQLCFDPGPLLQWEAHLRDSGVTLPVHVGLPGLISPRMLVRYGLKCGVGQSLQFLKGQRHRLHRWFWPSAPEQVIEPVARAVASDAGSLFQGFHFFPFGAVARTLAWREASGRP